MKRSFSAAFGILLIGVFLASAAAPLVAAQSGGQFTYYYTRLPGGEPLEGGIGRTREDDGVTSSQPGGRLDAIANKVVLNATDEIGLGAQMLDSVWYSTYPYAIDSNHYLASAGADRQQMFGSGQFMAWYGWWNDLDNDDRINDFHDNGACPVTVANCRAIDEFKWRGIGNGEPGIEMILYVLPTTMHPDGFYNNVHGVQRIASGFTNRNDPLDWQLGAWSDGNASSLDAIYRDRTGFTESQQLWVPMDGGNYLWTDESLIITTQAITIANARRTTSQVGYDFADPDALIDVDRYESSNGDVESLWLSTMKPIPDEVVKLLRTPQQIGPMVNDYIKQVTILVNEVSRRIQQLDDDAIALREEHVDPITGNLQAQVNREAADAQANLVNPLWLKEPNNVRDEYPGAIFGGVPSGDGAGNDYSAHLGEFHLYLDARLTTEYVVPANVQIEPLGVSAGQYFWVLRTSTEHLPCSQHCDESPRGLQPGILAGNVYVGLWHDENGDKWPGSVCNPNNPSAWNEERDVCANDGRFDGYPSDNGDPFDHSDELLSICGTTTLSGGGSATTRGLGLRIYPAPGSTWEDAPGAAKLREWQRPTYNLWHTNEQQVPTGTEVVELEWYSCSGDVMENYAIDALFLPSGTASINLVTEVFVQMTKPYVNAELGLTLPIEELRDVDIYYASL